MDNGEVIPSLNEDWNLAGAKIMEWISGLIMALMCAELFQMKSARYSPMLMFILLATTLGLAALRRRFPDEERGVRNQLMVGMGLHPPGIPTPAPLQPYWSGTPVREMEGTSYYNELQLGALFAQKDSEQEVSS